MGVTTIDVTGVEAGALASVPAQSPRGFGSRWLREVRHLPDSLLHARRRRAAQLLLQNLKPRSILFLCHANICRSPFAAEAFVRSCSPHNAASLTVRSAGFIGPGRTPPPRARAAGAKHGVDIASHRSAVVTTESLRGSDLVVVMSSDQARGIRARTPPRTGVLVLGDLDPIPVDRRTIPDPWGGPDTAFDASYVRINRCVRELARLIGAAD